MKQATLITGGQQAQSEALGADVWSLIIRVVILVCFIILNL